MTLDDFLVDKRTIERNIKDGRVDAADYKRMLDALPDRSSSIWRKPIVSEAASEDSSAE